MSGVIKAGDRSFGPMIVALDLGREEPTGPATREDPLVSENARLRKLLAEKEAEIAVLGETVGHARAEGEDAGRLAAEQAFEDDRQEALRLLADGIARAQEGLGDFVERAEALALLFTRAIVDKLFGEDADRQRIVGDLLRHQIAQIERHSLVAIEVSRLDFPDTREVAELAARLQLDPTALRVDEGIDAGACRMRLKLGILEVGPDRQWQAVRDMLDGLAGAPDFAG